MAKHLCDMCRPHQRELTRLKAASLLGRRSKDDIEVATYKLEVVRNLVCSDSPPPLEEAYQSGGRHRKFFLDNRITAKCSRCQRLADELVIVSQGAQWLRSTADPQAEDQASAVDYAALQTHVARMLEELLDECERVMCGPGDEI